MSKKSKEVNTLPPDPEELAASASATEWGWTGRLTMIPATSQTNGSPIKLKEIDENSVHEWVHNMINWGHKNAGAHYAPSALKYFAHEMYDIFSNEYKAICRHIDSASPDYVPAAPPEEHVPTVVEDDDEMLPPVTVKKRILKKKK